MKNTPPKWAKYLLTRFHPEDTLEEVEGDLEEFYAYWCKKYGEFWADIRYSLNLLTVLPPFVRRRKRKESYYQPSILHPAMLRNYFKIAFRTIAHNKAYSGINILGLSIGLAAAMLIMLYTKDEVSYDQYHTNSNQIFRIVRKDIKPDGQVENGSDHTGYLEGPSFNKGVPEVSSFLRFQPNRKDLKQGDEIVSQEVFLTDKNFFSFFTFPLLRGNPAKALEEPKSVVISEDMAIKQFGSIEVLGKTMDFKTNGQFEPYVITGIAQKSPQNSSVKFEVLLPMVVKNEELSNKENWLASFMNTFVLLSPHASSVSRVEAKINRVYQIEAKEAISIAREKYDNKNQVLYALQPFTDMHLSKDFPVNNGLKDASNPIYSYILSGIALFLLAIACINSVNLTIARSLARAKEIGIRKVVGGARKNLIMQFLGESYLFCFISFILAILLVILILPTFSQFSNKVLDITYLFDASLLILLISLFVITGFLSGFYPALVLSGYQPIKTLYNRFTLAGKNYLQKSLVVFQFALASLLIIATITIYSQFDYLINKDLGYDYQDVIMVAKRNLKNSEVNVVRDELLKNPNIRVVAPKNGGSGGRLAKINGDTEFHFAYESIDTNYLPMMKIPVVKGRNFSASFSTDSTQAVLVNETFVKQAGWKNPIGEEVNFFYNNEKYKVIGVVKDYNYAPLNEEIGPQLFSMKPGNNFGNLLIKIKPRTETASLAYIEKTFKKMFPIHPYMFRFLEEENRKNYESEAKWRQIMLFGAIMTIFISCIGLFGLATLAAERRTKEIGVRKTLGASASSIVQLLSLDFIRLVLFSFIIAFPVAFYAISEWLKNYPYRIEISAWIFIGAGLLAIAIALFTVSFQSIRAAMMNPVKSLKNE
ncbi:ABC transporter permease [Emticicia sp. BO119]|uniref:ABC transporter permease n=1 Tax=Emticicia sp. BO119 TaxID=2757768 RepID=UPI0015F05397|nr:ABC transporter permease [Emticicia sp. BO119]MBA4852996.1 ABC transporter permease [Emticicia sp. BO119]